jgi:hypothetical protein
MDSHQLSACYPQRSLSFERYQFHIQVPVHYTLRLYENVYIKEQLIDMSVFQCSMHSTIALKFILHDDLVPDQTKHA